MFSSESRYANTPDGTFTDESGRTHAYKLRRRIPRDITGPTQTITAQYLDRPDLISNRALGDPKLYWHLCDINGFLRPDDMAEAGTPIHITPISGRGR